ncbi:transglycosylase domain-containing protein [Streptomyces sp. AN091965]|uniref:transglycosylase domain-containing protein n=1 Tax=Streptomyces sp. AN091965 TaxID=2927803 RepID=UPI0035A8E1B9
MSSDEPQQQRGPGRGPADGPGEPAAPEDGPAAPRQDTPEGARRPADAGRPGVPGKGDRPARPDDPAARPGRGAPDPATQQIRPVTDRDGAAPRGKGGDGAAPLRKNGSAAPPQGTPAAGANDPATQQIRPVKAGAQGAAAAGAAGAAAKGGPATTRLRPVRPEGPGAAHQEPGNGRPQGWAPRDPDEGGAGDGDGASPAGPVAPGQQGKKGKKAKRPKRKGWRRLFPTWRMVLGAFILFILLGVGAFMTGYFLVNIPPANAMATKQSNVYLYSDGTEIARDGKVNRENVPLSKVPKKVQHAVLAAEDRDFYSESAVDPKAMLRAGWNTLTGKGKQSGSTITQQYVKNYYLAQEQTVSRKVKEFFIAIKLDREVSKDEILQGYLNTSYFGRSAYGVQAAAQAYYGKDVEDLSVGQGAYLATLVNSPNAYDVATHPENKPRAVARWNYVLDGMVKEGWLDRAERDKVKFPMPEQAKGAPGLSGQRGYVVKAVEDYLIENRIVDEDALSKGGYRITTTLQKPKQDAFVKAVDEQVMSKIDKKARKIDKDVRVGGASVDPKTGKVVAMYGGIDYTKQFVNNATRRDYQVGSTFKPFVFTSAVENDSTTQDGRPITPNTVYDGNNRRPVQGWDGGTYAPANEDDYQYGDISVREATDKSVNSVYAQMAVDVGSDKVKETAVSLGVPAKTPDLTASPSIALGPSTASVLDMTEAYATLANHGKHGTYTLVEKISKDGQDIALPQRKTSTAVSREAADTTTSILQSVVQSGTGREALAAGRPAAGKTGTAENDKAAWFAGYTPDLATVVAVMGQDPVTATQTPLYGALGETRINGGGYPAKVWAQFTKDALEGKPVKEFDLQLEPGSEEPVAPDPSQTAQDPDEGDDTGGATDGGPSEEPDQGGQTQGGRTQEPTGGQGQGGQDQGGRDQGGQTQDPTGGQDQGATQGGGGADGGGATGDNDGGQGGGAAQGALGGLTVGPGGRDRDD